jgi:hypothetical protein
VHRQRLLDAFLEERPGAGLRGAGADLGVTACRALVHLAVEKDASADAQILQEPHRAEPRRDASERVRQELRTQEGEQQRDEPLVQPVALEKLAASKLELQEHCEQADEQRLAARLARNAKELLEQSPELEAAQPDALRELERMLAASQP